MLTIDSKPNGGNRVRGIAVGRIRTVPLVGEARAKKPEESDEAYLEHCQRWAAWSTIQVQVRHQSRRKVQLTVLEVENARAQAEALQATPDGRAFMEHAFKVRDLLRDFLASPVVDATGATLGPVLVGVSGLELEVGDGQVIDVGTLTDPAQLLSAIEECDLLEAVASAAIRAQEPTVKQGN